MPDNTFGRNNARNARIVEAWSAGLSYTQIGRKEGMTRSAVAGVVFRSQNPTRQDRPVRA